MRALRVIEFLSMDGVMQSPGDPDEDREDGFRHGGWAAEYFDEVLGGNAAEGMAATDTYLFGRKTYEAMAGYWPTAPKENPFTDHLNRTPKYVASTTMQDLPWQNSTLIKGDTAEEVAKLKDRPGNNIAVLGSGTLVHTLMENDLIDEYFLTVYPIVIGSGKRLFRDAEETTKLDLVDSKPTTTGGLILTYRPAHSTRSLVR